jgi:predicted transcriptional regulator
MIIPSDKIEKLHSKIREQRKILIALIKLYGKQGVYLDDRDLADVADDDKLQVRYSKVANRTHYVVKVNP